MRCKDALEASESETRPMDRSLDVPVLSEGHPGTRTGMSCELSQKRECNLQRGTLEIFQNGRDIHDSFFVCCSSEAGCDEFSNYTRRGLLYTAF